MFVSDDMIRQMEERFGVPVSRTYRIATTAHELARIASSQKHGRNHDVTLYVQKDDKWIVIAKHPYPAGLFRSPSGGLDPGEDFIDGINRESAEELGCTVALERFLLKTDVEFFLEKEMPLADIPPQRMGLLYGTPMTADRKSLKNRITVYRAPDEKPDGKQIPELIRWRSWVFLARYVDGDFRYTDHHEIREVRLVNWDQFAEYGTIMKTAGGGGLYYRALLHETVAELLGKP